MPLIARVVPFVRLPRGIDFFDYSIPDPIVQKLMRGSRVAIPFRTKVIDGIVWEVALMHKEKKLKDVTEIFSCAPVPHHLLALVDWAAHYYACSRSLLLPLVAGPRLKRVKKQSTVSPDIPAEPTDRQGLLFNASTKSIIRWTDYAWRDTYIRDSVRSHLDSNTQLMVLCPTLKRTQEIVAMLKTVADNRLCVFTGDMAKGVEISAREKLKDGSIAIAVGTRPLAFVDMPRLATILIDKAHRDEHAQYDMNPRYDARTVVAKRSDMERVRIVMMSPAPRLEEVQEVRLGRADYEEHTTPLPARSVAQLSDLWKSGQKGFISDTLREAAEESFASGKDVFFLVNKKGYASTMICQECEWCFTCSSCHTALPGIKIEKVVCTICATPSNVPLRCPVCKSSRFLLPGIGLEKVAEQAQTMFPTVPCLQISSDTTSSETVHHYLQTLSAKPTLVIGTSIVPKEHGSLFGRFGTLGILTADSTATRLNFRAYEEQWRVLSAMMLLARKHSSHIVFQAFNCASPFMRDVLADDYINFADRTLQERKDFGWPPVRRCMLVLPKSGRGGKREPLNTVIARIQEQCVSERGSFQLTVLSRGKPLERLLVRFMEKEYQWLPTSLPPLAEKMIACLPSEWVVDTDPISL